MKKLLLLILLLSSTTTIFAAPVQPGAENLNAYLPLLKNKNVGVFINHSSLIGKKNLVDVLLARGVHVTTIFVPEHGLRGNADAGAIIKDHIDPETHLPVISLYGKKVKPTPQDLQNIDILLYDIQDVGVRYYTYISSLQKLMEAAVQNNKPLIILDRPNPNGFYVDGPVLQPSYQSFTGMQPIPIVYGMTPGEYANMLAGEEWLHLTPKSSSHNLTLTVIRNRHYTHKSLYEPPVPPSPSLPNIQSIYWYGSIGILESTDLSVGRGTDKPFQYVGHPAYDLPFTFMPVHKPGFLKPQFMNKVCHGWDLSGTKQAVLKKINRQIQLDFIIKAYQLFPDKKHFFYNGFNYAVGNHVLIEQIKSGVSEKEIRKSWAPALKHFKTIRKKYLLYEDFEE